MLFLKGERVYADGKLGTVVFQRMKAPSYSQPEVVFVCLEEKKNDSGYVGTVFPADQVEHSFYAEQNDLDEDDFKKDSDPPSSRRVFRLNRGI